MNPSTELSLFERFHQLSLDKEWLEGWDLFERCTARIEDTFPTLTTISLKTPLSQAQVRIKWHPSGRHLQWMECTCTQHRSRKKNCEHMVATLFFLEKQRPKLIEKLDNQTLISLFGAHTKPPAAVIAAAQEASTPLPLSQLESLQLVGKGPMIRARFATATLQGSPHHRTQDFGLDDAARLLEAIKGESALLQAIAPLKTLPWVAKIGTKLDLLPNGAIQAKRVIALQVPENSSLPAYLQPMESYLERENGTADQAQRLFAFQAFPAAMPFLGKQFFFAPGLGYFPLQGQPVKPSWFELPVTQVFEEEKAVALLEGHFHSFLELGPIWLHPKILPVSVLHTPSLHSMTAREDNGWFYLAPYYQIGEESLALSELLLHYRKKKSRYLKKGDHWVQVPTFLTDYDWHIDEAEGTFKVQGLELFRLEAHLGHFDQIAGSREVLARLQHHQSPLPDMPLPSLSHTGLSLRGYQEEGLQWAWWLYQNQFHGLLADDMGLGKTHQAMALLASIQKTSPTPCRFLVIAPTSVLDHWRDKMVQYAPVLNPVLYYGTQRADILQKLSPAETCTLITSYGVLLRDWRALQNPGWQVVILDEAHLVKNQKTATYRAACKLPARMRLGLTGTPMENHLRELKNLFDFLLPGYLGSDVYFQKTFLTPITKHKDPQVQETLQRLIHPFKLRRTKSQVLPELPDKTEDTRFCPLSPEQTQLYSNVLAMQAQPLLEKLRTPTAAIPYLHIFSTLQLLKQICNHPASLQENTSYRDHSSGKFSLFQELLDEAIASGQKVVVFSQYLRMLNLISQYCNDQKISYVLMTGQTRNRKAVIDQFQNDPTTSVFLGSLLAGGVGIDLTAASVVIHYDRWWNASKENQATDRVHRIGQKNYVQVLKLVTKGTLEEKIDAMIRTKQGLFERFLEKDEDLFRKLDRKEMIQLLEAIPSHDTP